ncbi:UNVERIFIED_CONTAM: hypothetical protein Scaly_0812200 [Sesamum calycinum]|uniref:Uncharacterized protein n=1 Tax=Sesamum calycinum TaxID=2727403 RepID=A0AAW2RBE2_9LAMI
MSKKRSSSTSSNHVTDNGTQIPAETPQFCYMFWCCRKPTSSTPQQLCSSPTTLVHQPQSNKDLWLKPFGDDDHHEEDSNFPGLPRFLFTITEESREDLESEVGMSRRRNLSDLLQVLETPFLTPLASSPAASHDHYFTPPLTPSLLHHHNKSSSAELMKMMMRSNSSPPPKLKFLRDAEEKLMMRTDSSPPPKMKFLRDAEEKLLLRSQTRTTIMQEINGEGNNKIIIWRN